MRISGNEDAIEKKINDLKNRLKNEKQALNKVLKAVENETKLKQSNK